MYDFQVVLEDDRRELSIGGAVLLMLFLVSLRPCGGSCTPSSSPPHSPPLFEQCFATTDLVLQLQTTDNHRVNLYLTVLRSDGTLK